jgi:hypothetical protein
MPVNDIDIDTETDIDSGTEIKEGMQGNKPPSTVPAGQAPASPSIFDSFWSAYPRKEGKGKAIQVWNKIKAPSETLQLILVALEWQKQTDQWKKENGQYIPMPSTYLNQQRWLDEKNVPLKKISVNPADYFNQLDKEYAP